MSEDLKKEQLDVINHNNGNILVSASAGSGKTFVMISRLIRLITEKKASVKEIMAVTFTEASAIDMKEKLYNALVKKINETGDKDLIRELGDISYADISTIDSFCSRLVRTYFYKVGVSPDYSIIDDVISEKLKTESINNVFSSYYSSGDKEFLTLSDRYLSGRQDNALKGIIFGLYSYIATEPNGLELFEKTKALYTEKGYREVEKSYKKIIDSKLQKIKNDLQKNCEMCVNNGFIKGSEFCLKVIDAINIYLREDSILVFSKYPFNVRADFGKNLCEENIPLKEIAKALRDEVTSAIKGVTKIANEENLKEKLDTLLGQIAKLKEIVERFTEYYDNAKKEENCLDFNDLEKFALLALKDQTVKEEVSKKYKYIFVDEYQDINGIQEEIINLIASDNLFMVGDVKQSIYGFRGCRPDFFSNKLLKMEEKGDSTVYLNYNFRSAKNVIEFVNKVFSYSMTEEVYGQSYKDKSKLVYGGLYEEDAFGRAEVHHLKIEKESKRGLKEEPRIYDILNEYDKQEDAKESNSAILVANIIRNELDKEYYDFVSKTYKRVNFSDIAIITRDKNVDFVRELICGLIKRGIPISSESDESVIIYPEIKVMINILKLIDCGLNDIALATVMKSPVGRFTDEELLEIELFFKDNYTKEDRRDKCYFDAVDFYLENAKTSLKDKLLDFINYIDNIRVLSDFVSAKEIMEKIVSEKEIEGFLLATEMGDKKVERLRFFISLSASPLKEYSVKEFLGIIASSPNSFKLSNGGCEQTVKLLSIHKSKGLEFPVVIVCGLERKINTKDESEEVLKDRDMGFAIRTFNDTLRTKESNIYRCYFQEMINQNTIKEELRLFYVALTRAKYALHLAIVDDKINGQEEFNGASCFVDYLPKDIPIKTYTLDDLILETKNREIRKVLVDNEDVELTKTMQKNFSYIYPHLSDTMLPLKTNVTALNQRAEKEYKVIELFDEGENITSREKGNIAHKFLELYDFINMPSAFDMAKTLLGNKAMTKQEIESISLEKIDAVIKSGVFSGLRGKKLYREQSFLVNVDSKLALNSGESEILIQGVIDLLAIGDDGAIIIDYKYSSHTKEQLKESYKKQLSLYGYAVEKILNIKVIKKQIVSLLTGETVLID